MNFSSKRMKGVSDRSFMPIKIPFEKDCTHSEVLKQCRSRVSLFAETILCHGIIL